MSDHAERLRELATHFQEHHLMTFNEEIFAEQTRETLEYAARHIEEIEAELAEVMTRE